MKIVACLGNPGKKYARNRHNAGFIIGTFLMEESGIALSQKSFSSISGLGKFEGEDALILVPQTFMNNSGEAVQKAMNFYKADISDLIVIHDEIELAFGIVKGKLGGGHKGHNGLRSIIQHVGSADFYRLRFGVGRPDNPHLEVADYVLSDFTPEEAEKIRDMYPEIKELLLRMVRGETIR